MPDSKQQLRRTVEESAQNLYLAPVLMVLPDRIMYSISLSMAQDQALEVALAA